MNTNKLVYGVVGVVIAHLAVANSSSLMMAAVYYLVGSTVTGILLNKYLGSVDGSLDLVSLSGMGVVVYIFYKKYGLTGVAASVLLGPFVVAMVLSMLSRAGLNL